MSEEVGLSINLRMNFNGLGKECGMDGLIIQGGQPVTNPMFEPEGELQLTFLLRQHPMQPPKPIATFAPHSANGL